MRNLILLVPLLLLAGARAQTPAPSSGFPHTEPGPAWSDLYDFEAGWLGVHHETDRFLFWETGKGARVLGVVKGSPARRGGLVAGDIITHFHGRRVTRSADLDRMVQEAPAGSIVVLDLLRGAVRYQTVVELDPRPYFDKIYRRNALQIPHPGPILFDYEEYPAFKYRRISFLWPLLKWEDSGRKSRMTVVTWPFTMEIERDR